MPETREPPATFAAVLRSLGPGLIIAASIVGSGELIATTRTGAEAGFSLLWLILLGCLVKVFAQIEISRHCIAAGETTVTALNRIPGFGPFVAWFWFITFLTGLGQLGGIVGGVGQAVAIFLPVESVAGDRGDLFWAALATVATVVMLWRGGFGFIEVFCTVLVATFTFLTVGNLFALQTQADWAIAGSDLLDGLTPGLPDSPAALATALATFGIIGIGAAEVVAYPYWCLEKGYGRWIGRREDDPAWARRARGWMRVLRWDAWGSMVVYTLSTAAFYLLGAAVLHRMGLVPAGSEMIATLAEIYGPVFGSAGTIVLLIGAFAVLFSTFFVSNATKSRLMTDALHVFRLRRLTDESARGRSVRFFGVVFPLLCFAIYALYPKPVTLILISGAMQALLLPLLGFAALYFRYRTVDPALRPGKLWDAMLILSVVSFVVVGAATAWSKGAELIAFFGG